MKALVVGASRGIGLALVAEYLDRGWHVVATTRGRGDEGLQALEQERLRVVVADVNDAEAPAAIADAVGVEPLDLLVHSAGVLGDAETPAGRLTPQDFASVLLTNAFAPLRVIEALADRVAAGGTVAAVSSILGSVGGNGTGGYDVYRASKAALNTLLRCHAVRNPGRCIVAMHPGWVRTAMSGDGASLTPRDSARGIADALAARAGEPGCVFLDWRGRAVDW